MNITVMDIGATTLNLLTATVEDGGLIKRGESTRYVRFGEGTLLSGFISEPAWASACDGVGSMICAARARGRGALVAVATSVVREASNGPAFRKALARQFDLDVQVLSSRDEALLAYRGARSRCAGDKRLVVVDIGGGCINFAAGDGPEASWTSSLPLGTVRMEPAFSPGGSLSRRDAAALGELMRRSLTPLAQQLEDRQPFRLVFSSGAARAVREQVMLRSGYPGTTGAMDRETLAETQRKVTGARAADLIDAGVRPELAGSFAIATCLMRTIMDLLAVEQALVVDRGLREGAALAHHEALERGLATAERR